MYKVISILKDKKGNTIGAKIEYNGYRINLSTIKLINLHGRVEFENAIITKDGFVKAKSGNLPVEIFDINRKIKQLYHGSDGGIHYPIEVQHKNVCDFGDGFYLGTDLIQAENRVCTSDNGYVYTFNLNMNNLKVHEFKDAVLWALFVGVNRNKINNIDDYPKLKTIVEIINSYDVIIGWIADDKMYQSFNRFFEDTLSDVALSACLKLVNYGKQYVIKNKKNCISPILEEIGCHKLNAVEKENAQRWGRTSKYELDRRIAKVNIDYFGKGKLFSVLMEGFK